MGTDSALIELLSDGRFHSGEALGRALGISRAAVWKRLQRLEDLGLHCERVRGKGYRLPGGIDPLQQHRVMELLAGAGATFPVEVVQRTGSTNADLLSRVQAGAKVPTALLAEYQSAGRGRRGRPWVSPYGRSLYLSLAWPFSGGAAQLEGLSLAVGVVLAELLAEIGVTGPGLKWPNDVLVEGRKLAGVLVELAGDVDGQCVAIIGVGMNGELGASGDDIDQAWTDLGRELGRIPERSWLAGKLLADLAAMLALFADRGFASLRSRWELFDVCRDRPVRVSVGEASHAGMARGVAGNGALLVEIDGDIRHFHGGEVTLRMT
jgi:BirA family biotin operon repressor/biotin-[acetyl-CoA-carboxylase] ligase